jgi:hypothetical protein
MTHNSHTPARDSDDYRVYKTHCQGHQDPSKRVPISLGTQEASVKMVPICSVPIPRSRTVMFFDNTFRAAVGDFPGQYESAKATHSGRSLGYR